MIDKRDISSFFPGVAQAAIAELYRIQGFEPTRYSEECARAAGAFFLGEALLNRLRKRYPEFVGDWTKGGVHRTDIIAIVNRLGGPEHYVNEYPLVHLSRCDLLRIIEVITGMTDEIVDKYYKYVEERDSMAGTVYGKERAPLFDMFMSVIDDRVTITALKPGGALDFTPYEITIGAERRIVGGAHRIEKIIVTDCAINEEGVTIKTIDLSARPKEEKHLKIENGLELHGITLTRQIPDGTTLAEGLRSEIKIEAEGEGFLTAGDLSHPWKVTLTVEEPETAAPLPQ